MLEHLNLILIASSRGTTDNIIYFCVSSIVTFEIEQKPWNAEALDFNFMHILLCLREEFESTIHCLLKALAAF